MTRRERRTIFYILLGLFFVLGAAIVLYAEGWRIDLKDWRPEKVGAIYVRSFPEYTAISLDGKPVPNGAGLLSRGTLISDLYPRTYRLALSAEGYDPWVENAEVLPSLVTEFNTAVLIPSEGVAIGTSTVLSFAIAEGTPITESASGAIARQGTAIARGAIVGAGPDISDILVRNPATGAYALYDLANGTSTRLDEAGIANAVIDPYDAARAAAATSRRVFLFDEARATSTVVSAAPGTAVIEPPLAFSPAMLAWTRFTSASDTSVLAYYDLASQVLARASTTVPGRTVALAWMSRSAFELLQDDGSLYLYHTDSKTLTKLADDVTAFAATPDGSLIAALERHGLEIFPFTSAETYHRFNLPNAAGATDVVWYKDMEHLFVVYPGRVALLDLGDLGLANFTTVGEGTAPFYDATANALYLIDPQGKLVRFDFPS